MVIRRVNPMSVAKIAGLLYAIIGLVIGALMSLFFMAVGSAMPEEASSHVMGAMFGAGAIVVMPVFYGVLGFVGTAIAALIYNALAGMIGGIEIEIDSVATSAPRV
jgi:hypothetical protein